MWLSLVMTLAACGTVALRPDAAASDATLVDAAATDATPIDADAGVLPDGKPVVRAVTDRPDEVTGNQVHALYVVPSDGVDRQLDTSPSLATSIEAWSQWIPRKLGGVRLRLDTADGKPDITFVRLARSNAELAATGEFIRDAIEHDLGTLGQINLNKIYAVYYDGDATTCGGAPFPPTLVGRVSALYLDGHPPSSIPCRDTPLAASADAPGYFEFSMVRGLFHALGAVPTCAPHAAGSDVSDSASDIMYSGPLAWAPSEIDVGRDDYWGHAILGCLDLARSRFLEPQPTNAELPPGW